MEDIGQLILLVLSGCVTNQIKDSGLVDSGTIPGLTKKSKNPKKIQKIQKKNLKYPRISLKSKKIQKKSKNPKKPK